MIYISNIIINLKKHFMFYFTMIIIFIKTLIFNKYLLNISIFSYTFFEFLTYIYSCISCVIVFLSFSFLFKNRLRNWYLFFINTVFSLILIIDLIYHKAFGRLPSIFSTCQIKDAGALFDSVIVLFEFKFIIFIMDLIIILFIFSIRKEKTMVPSNIQTFIMLFIIFGFYSITILKSNIIKYDVFQHIYYFSPISYHISDTFIQLKENRKLVLSREEIKEIKDWYKQKNKEATNTDLRGIFKGDNVIFIQFESLENFIINRNYDNVEITPILNKMIKNGLYFSNIYDQTNEGTSSDANLMVNTSIYPLRRGSTFYGYGDNSYNSLSKILKKYGYFSSDIYPVYGEFWNWENNQKSFGFEKIYDVTYFGRTQKMGIEIYDKEYYEKIIPIILGQKEPFYTVICNISSHLPFDFIPEEEKLNLKTTLDRTVLGNYFSSVHYSDKQLGMFLESMDENNLLDNTVIVVYGDHEGVHKFLKKDIEKLNLKDESLANNNSKTPIIIYKKGFMPQEITVHGGLIDLLPTVCYLLGVEDNDYINTAMGKNLLTTKDDYTILANEKIIGNGDIKQKEHAIKGLYIADKIIKGNYFKNYVISGD